MPSFLTAAEELALAEAMAGELFQPLCMRGQRTRRGIVSYGLEFKPHVAHLEPAPPIPPYLHGVRERAARLAGMGAESFAQSLLTVYPPGSDIGWHIDHRCFGPTVVAVSLLGDATLSLRLGHELHRFVVERRSIYILRGPARFEYEHKVTARSQRISITLRPIATDVRRREPIARA